MPTPKRARRRKAKPPRSPYEGYESAEERLMARIETCDAAKTLIIHSVKDGYMPTPPYSPSWNKGGGRKPQPLYLEDLACGLWAVECVGDKGITYGQLDRCFKDCRGVGSHNNKASAILATLVDLNLIAKVGNYSVGRRGNVYAVWHERQPKPQPTPRPTRADKPNVIKPLIEDGEPW